MSEHLLHNADALMHRHRRYVARPASEETAAAPGSAANRAAEEVPTLTEVVDETHPPFLHDPGLLEAELVAWLQETLPQVLANLSGDLVDVLARRAREELLPRLSPASAPSPRQGSL